MPPFFIFKVAERVPYPTSPNLQKYPDDLDKFFENKKIPPEKIMRKGQKLSMGTRRWQATQERKLLRQFYEFQKNSRQKNRPKKSSTKYSGHDSFTQILKALWNVISKILKIF